MPWCLAQSILGSVGDEQMQLEINALRDRLAKKIANMKN
jgi:hypothetical protein